jgi:nucleotide-binding universal stress UspA family protein
MAADDVAGLPELDKHFLLTISDDRSASHNLRFASGFFGDKERIRLTLFYVSPSVPVTHPDAHDVLKQTALEEMTSAELHKGRAWLDEARQWALARGFPEDNVAVKAAPERFGTVRDIVTEGHKGLYDAVIVGRRGLSWFEEYLTRSVSKAILWQRVDFPLWVCRMPESWRRDVLLCVDGSGECLRMADHVGFVLADAPDHRVTVFHVRRKGVDAEEIIESVRAAILEHGVAEERIRVKVVGEGDAAAAILEEAHDNGGKGYAAVAVGRRQHAPAGPLGQVFMGSVSLKLQDKAEGFSLWISR